MDDSFAGQSESLTSPLVETLNLMTTASTADELRVQRIVEATADPEYVTARAFMAIGSGEGALSEANTILSIRLEGDPVDEFETLHLKPGVLYFFRVVEIEEAPLQDVRFYR